MDADTPGRIRKLQRALEYIPSDEPLEMPFDFGDPFNPTPKWMEPLERDLNDTFDNPFRLPEKSHHDNHAPPQKPPPQWQEQPAEDEPFGAPMWQAGIPAPRARRA